MTRIIASASVLTLGKKVLGEWQAHPELFAKADSTREAFAVVVTQADDAVHAAANARATRTNESLRLKAELTTAIARLKEAHKTTVAELDKAVQAADQTAQQFLGQLSRAAKGARYTAKASALSDESAENDALGEQL